MQVYHSTVRIHEYVCFLQLFIAYKQPCNNQSNRDNDEISNNLEDRSLDTAVDIIFISLTEVGRHVRSGVTIHSLGYKRKKVS